MTSRAERVISYIDIFLLTLAIGINTHLFAVWCLSPPTPEEYERAYAGRC